MAQEQIQKAYMSVKNKDASQVTTDKNVVQLCDEIMNIDDKDEQRKVLVNHNEFIQNQMKDSIMDVFHSSIANNADQKSQEQKKNQLKEAMDMVAKVKKQAFDVNNSEEPNKVNIDKINEIIPETKIDDEEDKTEETT